jgi:hypothetical protein
VANDADFGGQIFFFTTRHIAAETFRSKLQLAPCLNVLGSILQSQDWDRLA